MQRLLQEQYRLHLTALFTPLLDVFFMALTLYMQANALCRTINGKIVR